LYVCYKKSLSKYNLNGEIVATHPLYNAFDVDVDTNNLLYVADETDISILNFELEIISKWPLPLKPDFLSRGIKVDKEILYLTMANLHQIFICHKQNGQVITKWGNTAESEKEGEFARPRGITVDNSFVYVCDSGNHRIQILTKGQGSFVSQWGGNGNEQFMHPLSIYNDWADEIFYIGDYYSLQLFTKEGICIQKFGAKEGNKMDSVRGAAILDDRLFVCDYENQGIQIFTQK